MEEERNHLGLPGFRFHPTEAELLDFYLRNAAYGKKLDVDIIGTLNLYLYDPWDLPAKAKIGEREWYFFVPRDRRHSNGGRPNRTTERGFWKATGSDRPVRSASDPKRLIGLKKTLVFYQGRAPRGSKTDWVMNEYRFPENSSSTPPKEDMVLCKVYRKATSLKELEQRAAMEGDTRAISGFAYTHDTFSSSSSSDHEASQKSNEANKKLKTVKAEAEACSSSSTAPAVVKGEEPGNEEEDARAGAAGAESELGLGAGPVPGAAVEPVDGALVPLRQSAQLLGSERCSMWNTGTQQ